MAKPAFDHCSEDYARFRPGYPRGAIDLVAHELSAFSGPTVVDAGAGTGIFTKALGKRGYRVIAIEPSWAMLKHVAIGDSDSPPQFIWRLRATAEQVPIAPASVHAVTCAQSFHWFNPPLALAEFARILVDGGLMALVWNNRDADDAFVVDFNALIAKWNPSYRREYRRQDWASKTAAVGLFEPMQIETFRWTWCVPQRDFVGLTRSVSYIRNVLPRGCVPQFEAGLRDLMRTHFCQDDCSIPMTTEAWWTRRKPR